VAAAAEGAARSRALEADLRAERQRGARLGMHDCFSPLLAVTLQTEPAVVYCCRTPLESHSQCVGS
jgi:hypothetical protein